MPRRDESSRNTPDETANPVPPPPPDQTIAAGDQTAATPPSPASTDAGPAPEPGQDYNVTLEDSAGNRQTVVAHGKDAGLAAQEAMRSRPGWTAQHQLTTEITPETPGGTPPQS